MDPAGAHIADHSIPAAVVYFDRLHLLDPGSNKKSNTSNLLDPGLTKSNTSPHAGLTKSNKVTAVHVAAERGSSGHRENPASVLCAGLGPTSARCQNFATPLQLRDKIKRVAPQAGQRPNMRNLEHTSCVVSAPDRNVERGNPWWTLYSTRLPNMKPSVQREVSQNRPSVG